MTHSKHTRGPLSRGMALAAGSMLALGLAACGEEALPEGAGDLPGEVTEATEALPEGAEETAQAVVENVIGTNCEDFPGIGVGDVASVAEDPVVTALEQSPELSTLAQAVESANLGETLSGAEGITLFAPSNAAFEGISSEQLQELLADPAQLGEILSFHVVEQQLSPEDLPGEFETLSGETITIEGEGEQFQVPADQTLSGENPAMIVCGNIATENAVLYLVDNVLQPAS